MPKNTTGIQARKMEVGEVIKFEDVIISSAFTQYGETLVCSFADQDGKVFRKVMSNSLGKFLKDKPQAKMITLKKKIVDGELTHNLWYAE